MIPIHEVDRFLFESVWCVKGGVAVPDHALWRGRRRDQSRTCVRNVTRVDAERSPTYFACLHCCSCIHSRDGSDLAEQRRLIFIRYWNLVSLPPWRLYNVFPHRYLDGPEYM
jgi:hypothetical protein